MKFYNKDDIALVICMLCLLLLTTVVVIFKVIFVSGMISFIIMSDGRKNRVKTNSFLGFIEIFYLSIFCYACFHSIK